MQDLLKLISAERAERLLLQVGKPPALYLRGEAHLVEGPHVTRENAAALFQSLASPEQVRELDVCGDSRFIYSSPQGTKFRITAKVEREDISLEIRPFP